METLSSLQRLFDDGLTRLTLRTKSAAVPDMRTQTISAYTIGGRQNHWLVEHTTVVHPEPESGQAFLLVEDICLSSCNCEQIYYISQECIILRFQALEKNSTRQRPKSKSEMRVNATYTPHRTSLCLRKQKVARVQITSKCEDNFSINS